MILAFGKKPSKYLDCRGSPEYPILFSMAECRYQGATMGILIF